MCLSSTMKDRSRKCLTEEQKVLNRRTDIYNCESGGDNAVLDWTVVRKSFVRKSIL